jgi:RNA polymerase I-specific transcription initiation factor RRN11
MASSGSSSPFEFPSQDRRAVDPTSSTRLFHINRLNDILHLCIQRGDIPRAKKTWTILMRCPEVDWAPLWTTGLLFLPNEKRTPNNQVNYLRSMMLNRPEEVGVTHLPRPLNELAKPPPLGASVN